MSSPPPPEATGDAVHRYMPVVCPRPGQVGQGDHMHVPHSALLEAPVKKYLAAGAAGAAILLTLSACSGGGDEEASTEAGGVELVNAGTLTLCSDIPYEPFEFVQDGENVGLDIDLAQATADDLGV